ncbi:HipA domain-containing protein [Marivirga sp.]|uniref:type II toxin-antitoxin system HipA family toxin n=1 Tax=Marivirga sp. TaxID=2018662 RepID=UPI002D7FC20E|nr:HipA domain-containing protein [Marivirga sp.]
MKEVEIGFCKKCLQELFDGQKVAQELYFNSPYEEKSDSYLEHTKKISISGVQVKYSLRLEDDELKLTATGGQYILKPIPTGTFKFLDQAPANEHLTMQIAKQLFKMNVPANALMDFKDGSPAYIVRRFDQTHNHKIQQEDFAQIAQMTSETHGENYKYDLSYEEIAELIQEYIPTYKIELEKFFRMILFNYVFSNGDAHLKNFSVMKSEQGDYTLTPVYDLLCTRIQDMALDLLTDGFSNAFEASGFYTYQDFFEFGQRIGIKDSRITKILAEFTKSNKLVHHLIEQSNLNNECKKLYAEYYEDRLKRMNMNMV